MKYGVIRGGRSEIVSVPVTYGEHYVDPLVEHKDQEYVVAGAHLVEEFLECVLMEETKRTVDQNENIMLSLTEGCQHQRLQRATPVDILKHLKDLYNLLNKIGSDVSIIDDYLAVDSIANNLKVWNKQSRVSGDAVADLDGDDDWCDVDGAAPDKRDQKGCSAKVRNFLATHYPTWKAARFGVARRFFKRMTAGEGWQKWRTWVDAHYNFEAKVDHDFVMGANLQALDIMDKAGMHEYAPLVLRLLLPSDKFYSNTITAMRDVSKVSNLVLPLKGSKTFALALKRGEKELERVMSRAARTSDKQVAATTINKKADSKEKRSSAKSKAKAKCTNKGKNKLNAPTAVDIVVDTTPFLRDAIVSVENSLDAHEEADVDIEFVDDIIMSHIVFIVNGRATYPSNGGSVSVDAGEEQTIEITDYSRCRAHGQKLIAERHKAAPKRQASFEITEHTSGSNDCNVHDKVQPEQTELDSPTIAVLQLIENSPKLPGKLDTFITKNPMGMLVPAVDSTPSPKKFIAQLGITRRHAAFNDMTFKLGGTFEDDVERLLIKHHGQKDALISGIIDYLSEIVLTAVPNEFRMFANALLPVDIDSCLRNPKLAFLGSCFGQQFFVRLFMKYQSLYVLALGFRCASLAKEVSDANPSTDWQLQFFEDLSKHCEGLAFKLLTTSDFDAIESTAGSMNCDHWKQVLGVLLADVGRSMFAKDEGERARIRSSRESTLVKKNILELRATAVTSGVDLGQLDNKDDIVQHLLDGFILKKKTTEQELLATAFQVVRESKLQHQLEHAEELEGMIASAVDRIFF